LNIYIFSNILQERAVFMKQLWQNRQLYKGYLLGSYILRIAVTSELLFTFFRITITGWNQLLWHLRTMVICALKNHPDNLWICAAISNSHVTFGWIKVGRVSTFEHNQLMVGTGIE
jgi:hypothetical protein